MFLPTRQAGNGAYMPSAERLRSLQPYLDMLVDAAAEYDECAKDGELSLATDFIWWLQREAGGTPKRLTMLRPNKLLRAHSI